MEHKLYLALRAICQGYNESSYKKQKIFFKHFGLMDHVGVEEKHAEGLEYAKSRGLLTEEENLKFLIENKSWSENKEKQIATLTENLKYNQNSLGNLVVGTQRNQVKKQIKKIEEKLGQLLAEKQSVKGKTAEDVAQARANEYFIFKSVFKDSACTIPLFDEAQFKELEDLELGSLIKASNTIQENTGGQNIKLICIDPFFMNMYKLVKDPSQFFNKPVLSLTYLQVELLNYAEMFKVVLAESNIPESVRNDPDKLIEWYNSKHKTEQEMTKNSDKASSIIAGATKEDLKAMGVKDGIDARAAIRKKGGMSREETIKLLGG